MTAGNAPLSPAPAVRDFNLSALTVMYATSILLDGLYDNPRILARALRRAKRDRTTYDEAMKVAREWATENPHYYAPRPYPALAAKVVA